MVADLDGTNSLALQLTIGYTPQQICTKICTYSRGIVSKVRNEGQQRLAQGCYSSNAWSDKKPMKLTSRPWTLKLASATQSPTLRNSGFYPNSGPPNDLSLHQTTFLRMSCTKLGEVFLPAAGTVLSANNNISTTFCHVGKPVRSSWQPQALFYRQTTTSLQFSVM